MPTLKNVSPLGALDVTLIGRSVEAGEEFEVTAEQAKALTKQAESFESVTTKTKTEKKDD